MYSIESKKRKFDRVLESINNPSPTGKTQANAEADPKKTSSSLSLLAKNGSKKRLRLSDETSLKPSAEKTSSTSLQQQPNYIPHSQAAFLSRLSTFASIQKWRVSSSEEINAVEWARRGWSCVGREEVACHGGCEAQMLVNLDDEQTNQVNDPDDEDAEADEKMAAERHKLLVQKYKELITTAHLSQCPWRKRGCDDSIQRLPLLNAQSSIRDLQTRYKAILSLPSELPSNIRLDPDAETPLPSVLTTLSSDSSIFKSSHSTDSWSSRNRTAFLLALTGWAPAASSPHISPSASTTTLPLAPESDILECRSCFRRLGLWLYRHPSNITTSSPPDLSSVMQNLDLLPSHLDFCPWISSHAQNTTIEIDGKKQSFTGYELLLRNVEAEAKKIAAAATTGSRPGSREGSTVTNLEDGEGLDGVDRMSMITATTTEDREKRTKGLLKKIRELKRPFNVKALLKHQNRPDK